MSESWVRTKEAEEKLASLIEKVARLEKRGGGSGKIELWHFPSSRSSKIYLLARALGLQLTTHFVDVVGPLSGTASYPPEFLAVNPNGYLPVIRDEEGITYEASAIAQYLLDKYDLENKLLPTKFKKLFYWILSYTTTEVEPRAVAVFLWKVLNVNPANGERRKQEFQGVITKELEKLVAGRTTRYLVTDYLSALDIALSFSIIEAEIGGLLAEGSPLQEYYRVLISNPLVREAFNIDITKWLDSRKDKLTALVFFRGAWCPWCQSYLQEINKNFLKKIREHGGDVFAITAASIENAEQAKKNWKVDFDTLSDPSLALAKKFGIFITPKDKTPLRDVPHEYPNGMSQPGVVVLQGDKILFHWVINPNTQNLGGAKDRPDPEDVLRFVEAKLKNENAEAIQVKTMGGAFLKQNYPQLYANVYNWYSSNWTEALQVLAQEGN